MKKLFSRSRKKLTFDETQEVITPFAFTLDNALFGTAIASPYKRGLALMIDMALIGMLSSAGGELLAIALAFITFRSGRTPKTVATSVHSNDLNDQDAHKPIKVRGTKRRFLMRFIGAIIVLVVLLDNFSPMVNNIMGSDPIDANIINTDLDQTQIFDVSGNSKENNLLDGKEISFAQAMQITGLSIKILAEAEDKQCQTVECWQGLFQPVPQQIIDLDFSEHQAQELLSEIVAATELPAAQQHQLSDSLVADYQALRVTAKPLSRQALENIEEGTIDNPAQKLEEAVVDEVNTTPVQEQPNRPIYSFMSLIKGIIDDLGLGFGWAALYFTFFTAKWQGQTPGKKLFSIRVQQLDGTPLSMWDSFGRYGGYGAGIATGLLGFLQIFWDPNRQAIHDKISATVVTDDKKVVDPEIIEVARQRINEFNAKHQQQNTDGHTDCSEVRHS